MSWMERAPRAVASTSSDSSTRPRQTTPTRGRPSEVAPAIFPGTKEGAVASQESRFMRLPLAIAKARSQAMATRPSFSARAASTAPNSSSSVGLAAVRQPVGQAEAQVPQPMHFSGETTMPSSPKEMAPVVHTAAQRRHSPLRWRTSTQRWGSTASSGEFISSMRLIICPWR